MNTLNESYTSLSLIRPKSITATETGSSVNIEDYEDDAQAVMHLGALGGTTETFDGKVQVSVDGSTWTDACTFGQLTGADDNKSACGRVNLAGKKYVRGVITMSSTSASLVSMSINVRAKRGGPSLNSVTPA